MSSTTNKDEHQLGSTTNLHKDSNKDIINLEEVHLNTANNINELTHLWHTSEIRVRQADTTSSIGPLGLLGFGLTTFLLNLHNSGVFEMAPPILAMGFCYGGLAQIIAGILEWKKGNNFTSVAFVSYGCFWWSLVLVYGIINWKWLDEAKYSGDFNESMGWYLFLWFVFTFIMLIAAFTKPWAIRIVFATLDLLFILLASANWADGHKNTLKAAGIVGIICAISAIYAGAAEIINGAWMMTILPLGAPGEKWLAKISHE